MKFVNRLSLACALLTPLALLGPPAAQAASSPKKGFDTVVRPDGSWRRQVSTLHARWFYSWGGDAPANLPRGVEFVPMDWGYYGNKDNGLVTWLAKVKSQPGVSTLLGFNEPDGKDQANLTVEAALEGWPYLMQTGLMLGSPAAVHADGDWMKSFMRQADAEEVPGRFYYDPLVRRIKPAGLFGLPGPHS